SARRAPPPSRRIGGATWSGRSERPSAPRASWSVGSPVWKFVYLPEPVARRGAPPSGAGPICTSATPDRREAERGRHQMAEERVDVSEEIEDEVEEGAESPQPEVAKIRLKAQPSSDGRVRSK